MKDEELLQKISKIYFANEHQTEFERTRYLEVNPQKQNTLNKIVSFCEDMMKKGAIIQDVTRKEHLPSEICIRFLSPLTIGEDCPIMDFSEIISLCDGVVFEGTGLEDGSFEISFLVNDLYVDNRR